MTKKYSFSNYAPSLSDKQTAENIYQALLKMEPENHEIDIDVSTMNAMTTICARIIFGRLYLMLGDELFDKNIHVIGASETLKIVINWGIDSAIKSKEFEV